MPPVLSLDSRCPDAKSSWKISETPKSHNSLFCLSPRTSSQTVSVMSPHQWLTYFFSPDSKMIRYDQRCPNITWDAQPTWEAPSRVTSIQSRVLPLLTDPPNRVRRAWLLMLNGSHLWFGRKPQKSLSQGSGCCSSILTCKSLLCKVVCSWWRMKGHGNSNQRIFV